MNRLSTRITIPRMHTQALGGVAQTFELANEERECFESIIDCFEASKCFHLRSTAVRTSLLLSTLDQQHVMMIHGLFLSEARYLSAVVELLILLGRAISPLAALQHPHART